MIGKDDIRHLASLSRVSISEEEAASFEKEIEPVLEYVSKVKALNLPEGAGAQDYFPKNILREDGEPRVTAEEDRSVILDNAPRSQDGFFEVKKVLGQ